MYASLRFDSFLVFLCCHSISNLFLPGRFAPEIPVVSIIFVSFFFAPSLIFSIHYHPLISNLFRFYQGKKLKGKILGLNQWEGTFSFCSVIIAFWVFFILGRSFDVRKLQREKKRTFVNDNGLTEEEIGHFRRCCE